MKNLQVTFMATAFIAAGLSALMYFGQGVNTWIWQLICMVWIANCYMQEKRIIKLTK